MAYAICVAGAAGEDKTEFTQQLAAALEAKGVKTGLLLRALDQGAVSFWSASGQLSGGALSLQRSQQTDLSLDEVLGRYFFDLDLVLCQGFDEEKRAKVEWLPEGEQAQLAGDPGLRAVISSRTIDLDKPLFAPDDIKGLADYLINEVIPKSKQPRIRIVLGGKRIPAKEFVQDILADTIRAMVGSLKGGDRPGRLEIFIQADDED
jgi:molybdopterin-guanine dinucleotide biosynthesis protein B